MRKLFYFLMLLGLSACNWIELPEEEFNAENPLEALSMNDLQVPSGFDFTTVFEMSLTLEAVDNQGEKLYNVPFRVFKESTDSNQLLMAGTTGATGTYISTFSVAQITDKIILTTNYPGLPNRYEFQAQGGDFKLVMGEKDNRYVTQGIAQRESPAVINTTRFVRNSSVQLRSNNFSYMGTYNNQGVPDYLEPEDAVVDQALLDLIANSLPESQPVPTYNPQYISDGINSNTRLSESADIWVTFIHEGAGYRNALGYYTYPTGTPPANPEEVNDFKIIFPNVSYQGSGGGLNTGNKVFLGSFPAGISIGWFLIPNGWDAGARIVEIEDDKPVKYSTRNFNDFTNEAYQSHTVLLKSQESEFLVLGFEDIGRPGGDNDFNDAIFLVESNPFSAIQTDGLATAQSTSLDADSDGVGDVNDQFINDPSISFVNYSPAINQFGGLAFEDQWPQRGDYDMNDMIIDYNFIEYRDSDNKVIKLRGTFILQAMGAGFQNGFGFQLDIPPSTIQSVIGSRLEDNFINLAANGLETGQEKAVIIVFDNGHRIMRNPEGGFVNTEPGRLRVEPDTFKIDITLNTPLLASALGVAPYNPFLIKDRQRGFEIHLLDGVPTSKANQSLFNTGDDASQPGNGQYYQTANGLPWAIHISRSFDWPIEKEPVNRAYLKFNDWVQSSGFNYPDWYLAKPDYRNNAKVY